MENFIVSARKYRPQKFDSVIGQSSIANTLKNAISKNQIAHAYLFCGPRGIGKTTCARIFAKTINCQNPGPNIEACNECESCKSFNESRSYNIHELDAASNNSVDDIRNLIDQVRVPPQIGKYSTYIIDEVHMLSASAFNAFLKTLEEPPAHAIFILATTEKHKILPTILSRCQIFDFNRIKSEDIVAHLAYVAKQENVNIEPESLNIIAQKADGAMRDALSIFDQMVSFSGKDILHKTVLENLNVLDYDYYFKLTQSFIQHDISSSLMMYNEILSKGFDGHNFVNGLSNHFRDLLVCKDEVTLPLLEIGASVREQYLGQTGNCSIDFLYKAYKKEEKPLSNSPELVRNGKTKYKPSTPSIGGVINGKVTSAPESQDADQGQSLALKTRREKQIENFSKEELMEKWLRFAEMIRKEKPRMATTLKVSNPVIKDDFAIEIEMSNKVQEDDFNLIIKADLANFLRQELKNDNLKIVTFVPEINKEKSLYTDEDKYKYLSEKNPNINKLKQRLNLDFE